LMSSRFVSTLGRMASDRRLLAGARGDFLLEWFRE